MRAHLLERTGRTDEAIAHFVAAASRTANRREQQFLTSQAARLTASQGSADRPAGPGPGPPHEYKTD